MSLRYPKYNGDKTTVVYPVYLEPNEPGYIAFVPDIGQATEGHSLAEAIYMARDLIGTMCVDYLQAGKPLPEPGQAEYELNGDTIKTLVDADLKAIPRRYRRGVRCL